MIIDGRSIAQEMIKKITTQTIQKKFLCVFSVGKNDASIGFIHQKKKIADILGVDFQVLTFSEEIQEEEIKKKIRDFGKDDMCGGIIVQLPLPAHIKKENILDEIPYKKDVDVLSKKAYEFFLNEQEPIPPAVGVFCEVLSHYQVLRNVSRETNLKFAVIGNGFLVGRPIVDYLNMMGRCVSVFDKGDVVQIKDIDVVVLGAGAPHLISGDMVKSGALVIDFGCSFINEKLCGDFNPSNVDDIFYTPTPGGTGPMLVTKLFENFYHLNKVFIN